MPEVSPLRDTQREMPKESTTPDLVELASAYLRAGNRGDLDAVMSFIRQNARPVGSTGHVQTRTAFTSEWEDGKIARVTVYYDIDEAGAAAERLAQERG
jgi:ketosteroid isomerase-like protein